MRTDSRNGSHHEVLRRMSVKVAEGATKVSATRSHWVRPASATTVSSVMVLLCSICARRGIVALARLVRIAGSSLDDDEDVSGLDGVAFAGGDAGDATGLGGL